MNAQGLIAFVIPVGCGLIGARAWREVCGDRDWIGLLIGWAVGVIGTLAAFAGVS